MFLIASNFGRPHNPYWYTSSAARATIVADDTSREIVAHARNHQVPVLSRQPLP